MENSYRGSFKKFTMDDLPHDPEIPPLEYMYIYTHIHMPHFLDSVTVLSPKLAIT